ncbi:CACL [Mytilus edulis]|uniref:SLC25A20_29 n=1 Tax=Mytilus edulis TaxID=6550 RepID=A0A8S3RZK3_MYTED|nr:CACL [Mytilus edulis]
MQAQAGFEKSNMFQTLAKTLRTQGVIGLYRGCIPPLWGSGIYRSSQFAVFEAVRVIGAGVIASTTRAIIETPLEFAKVRRQTQQTWHLKDVYTFKKPLIGPFLTSGIAATLAWWIVWPLEYMKCQIQSNYGEKVSVIQKMKIVIKERGGFFGLYRGIMPGTIRSFLANGTSMVVMQFAQRKVTELG